MRENIGEWMEDRQMEHQGGNCQHEGDPLVVADLTSAKDGTILIKFYEGLDNKNSLTYCGY